MLSRPDFEVSIYQFVINPYIDYNDINHPLKTSLEGGYVGNVLGSFTMQQTMYIRKNKYTLYDSYLFADPIEGEFYSLTRLDSKLSAISNSNIYTLTIALDSEVVSFERRVYSLFDLISDIGGFYGIIKALTVLIMNGFTTKIYNFYSVNKFNSMMRSCMTQNMVIFHLVSFYTFRLRTVKINAHIKIS